METIDPRTLDLKEKVKSLETKMSEAYKDILNLKSQINSLSEKNNELDMSCAHLSSKSLEYLKQIRALEDDKRKSISILPKEIKNVKKC